MEHFAQVNAATDFSRFTALRASARKDADAAFATVAKEFEALFIQLMLKSARDASIEGGLFNSRELKLYREMLDGQVALAMAEQGGLGFDAVLRQQLSMNSATPAHDRELELPAAKRFPSITAPSELAPALPGPSEVGAADVLKEAGLKLDVRHTMATHSASPSEQGDRSVMNKTPAGSAGAQGPAEFVASLEPLAEEAAKKLGLSPEVILAQAALETGWGKHVIPLPNGQSSHNYFGIKAGPNWAGDSVEVSTLEFINGRALKVKADFRAYPDPAAAFNDYVDFLARQPRYTQALDHGGDPKKFAVALGQAGYATDPRYAEKILSITGRITANSTNASRE